MRRIFWMAVGAGATVWTINKASRVARSLTPGSLADTAARGAVELGGAARSFAGEVHAGMLQRELELNRELGLDGSVLALPGPEGRPVLRGTARKRVAISAPGPSTTTDTAAPVPRPLDGTPAAPAATPALPTDITPYNRIEDH